MQCTARFLGGPTRAEVSAAAVTLPDGTAIRTDAPEIATQLSNFLGRTVTLHPRRPASDKQHCRRAFPGAAVAGFLARSSTMRKAVARIAALGPAGAELRSDFGREAGEPLPDMSVFPAELFEYVSPLGTYFDPFPIHVITTASLRALHARYPAGAWDARRFRPNFVIETAEEISGLVEAAWTGRVLRVGEVELECTVVTPRCSMVMQEQPGPREGREDSSDHRERGRTEYWGLREGAEDRPGHRGGRGRARVAFSPLLLSALSLPRGRGDHVAV